MPARRLANFFEPLLVSIFILISWWYLPPLLDVPTYVFPSLSDVWGDFTQSYKNYFQNFLYTALESLIGLAIACMVGSAIALGLALSSIAYRQILPILIVSNAIPVVAVAPLLGIWLGFGLSSKIAVSAFLCFFPFTLTFLEGLRSRQQVYEELFKLYGASRLNFLFLCMIPNALQFFIAGLKVTSSIAVIGAIVAEFVGSDRGLGFGILQASYNLNTPRIFGYVIISCLLSYAFYQFPKLLEKALALRHLL